MGVPFENLGSYDAVAILTDHSNVDYRRVLAEAKLVFDTRNATRKIRHDAKARVMML